MYLQGNLQLVFDALYNLGVIDPVLNLDWSEALEKWDRYSGKYSKLLKDLNNSQDSLEDIMSIMDKYDEEELNYLAMEVAREFADYHTRQDLH